MPNAMDVLLSVVAVVIVLTITSIVLSELDTNLDKADYSVDAQEAINKSVDAGFTAANIGSLVPLVMIFGLIMAALGYFNVKGK